MIPTTGSPFGPRPNQAQEAFKTFLKQQQDHLNIMKASQWADQQKKKATLKTNFVVNTTASPLLRPKQMFNVQPVQFQPLPTLPVSQKWSSRHRKLLILIALVILILIVLLLIS